ncbi:MAG TPA: hypothetical protein VII91_01755 [Bauldia sp.]
MKRVIFAGIGLCIALSAATVVVAAAQDNGPADAAAAAPAPAPAPAPKVKPAVKPAMTAAAAAVVWTGTINQVGRAQSYAIEVTLAAKGGKTTYPGQNCSGTLTKIGNAGDYTFFTESITAGKFDAGTKAGCLDGSLTLKKDGAAMVMTWMSSYNGKAVVAYGSLEAKKP